jgi:DNA processing protein
VHELYYWVALRQVCGVGNVICKILINHFKSPEKIFNASVEELKNVEGINVKAVEAITGFRPTDEIDREIDEILSKEINILTFNSPDYPENLKNIYDPPPFLYVKGSFIEGDKNSVAVVGSRNASEYGIKVTQELSRNLASLGVTIVSGMARGIDSAAHIAAIQGGGRTVAVLGSGVDVIYPPENRRLFERITENGAVVSEYPLGTRPNSYNFPPRNRIISGVSLGVLVVEASPKSGSLITAQLALDQGRDVYAVPGNVYSYKAKGTNSLLKSGAKLVDNARDIVEELNITVKPLKENKNVIQGLSSELLKIYDFFKDEPLHIDNIILKTGFSSGRVSALLLDLELSGILKQLPGKMFTKC